MKLLLIHHVLKTVAHRLTKGKLLFTNIKKIEKSPKNKKKFLG